MRRREVAMNSPARHKGDETPYFRDEAGSFPLIPRNQPAVSHRIDEREPRVESSS